MLAYANAQERDAAKKAHAQLKKQVLNLLAVLVQKHKY
jgi:hypothetical protein